MLDFEWSLKLYAICHYYSPNNFIEKLFCVFGVNVGLFWVCTGLTSGNSTLKLTCTSVIICMNTLILVSAWCSFLHLNSLFFKHVTNWPQLKQKNNTQLTYTKTITLSQARHVQKRISKQHCTSEMCFNVEYFDACGKVLLNLKEYISLKNKSSFTHVIPNLYDFRFLEDRTECWCFSILNHLVIRDC